MSVERSARTILHCDMDACLARVTWTTYLSRSGAETHARSEGWRKDKLGRNVCPAHPKLKGAKT